MSHNTESIFKASRTALVGAARNAGIRDISAKEKVRLLHLRLRLTKPTAPKPNIQSLNSWADEDKARQLRAAAESNRDFVKIVTHGARYGRDQSEDRKYPPIVLAYRDGAAVPDQNGYYAMDRATGKQVSMFALKSATAGTMVVQEHNRRRGWYE